MAEEFGAAYWEDRYQRHGAHGSHRPNPHLVAEAGQLQPGTALDAGCGEGSNALWLAEHGWRVTAVDVSVTALRRARERAETRAAAVADRLDWVQADLTVWEPPRERFDLVTAHYVHPAGSRQLFLARLGAAVAPGGTLFVVEHDDTDENARAHSPPEQLAASLDSDGWDIDVAESRLRRDADPDGHEITVHDAVLRARKRS